MYGNIANKLYMRIPDASQAEELVSTLGTCKILKQTRTRNVSASLHGVDDLFKSGYGERIDMADTELLPPSVLTSLPRGQGILVTQGYPPIKIRIPLLDRAGLPKESFFEKVISFYKEDSGQISQSSDSLFEIDPPAEDVAHFGDESNKSS